jgi:hypothetical protein
MCGSDASCLNANWFLFASWSPLTYRIFLQTNTGIQNWSGTMPSTDDVGPVSVGSASTHPCVRHTLLSPAPLILQDLRDADEQNMAVSMRCSYIHLQRTHRNSLQKTRKSAGYGLIWCTPTYLPEENEENFGQDNRSVPWLCMRVLQVYERLWTEFMLLVEFIGLFYINSWLHFVIFCETHSCPQSRLHRRCSVTASGFRRRMLPPTGPMPLSTLYSGLN